MSLLIGRLDNVRLNFSKGFTLLELLIYVVILAIVTTVIASLFISLNRGRGQVESRSEVNSNLQFALEKISRDLKYASAVNVPGASNSTSTNLIIAVNGSTITYDVSAGQMRRQINSESPQAITSDKVTVAAHLFTRLENVNQVLGKTLVSIEINVTMAYNSQSPDYQYAERKKTTVSLR